MNTPKCDRCGAPLIAVKQPDGAIHTWHRDAPCAKPTWTLAR